MSAPLPAPVAVPVSMLHPSSTNPRTISDDRLANLCRSLEADPEFLQLRPILANRDGTVFAGTMRLRAAMHLGWETVPAIIVDIPEKLAKERALRDNGSWGEWQEDDLAELLAELDGQGVQLDLLGFDDRELRDLLNRLDHEGGQTDPDAVPEVPAEPITKPGDLWLLGDHKILCGDSTDPQQVTFVMSGEKARLLVTDPPYLVGYTGDRPGQPGKANQWDIAGDDESAVKFYVAFIEAAKPHLEKRAPVYQWHADLRRQLVAAAWQQTGLLLHQILIWVKPHGVLTRSHYLWQHEPCAYGWLQGDMPKLKPPSTSTTVWQVDQKAEQDGSHPTQKPVELFKRPILAHTTPGDIVFDPFLGSGTAIIAAEMTGRRCFAMEQAPEYCDVAVTRWERFSGRKAERVEQALPGPATDGATATGGR